MLEPQGRGGVAHAYFLASSGFFDSSRRDAMRLGARGVLKPCGLGERSREVCRCEARLVAATVTEHHGEEARS